MDEPRSDYEAWVEDHVPQHVDAIIGALVGVRAPAPPRPTLLVDPGTGHLNRGLLCWVCFADDQLRDRRLPRFRGCRHCLIHDRRRASALGLKMLLPLMDYPSQPVLPGSSPLTNVRLRGVLADVWSQVSVLRKWRIDGVGLGYALFDVKADIKAGIGIGYAEWQERLCPGPMRSRACWTAFVQGYYPDLMAGLRTA